MQQNAPLAPGTLIPLPAKFPVQWESPAQARQCWFLDRMHFPDPIPPLVASVSHDLIEKPLNQAAARYALPMRLATLSVNTYLYLCFTPQGAPPEIVLRGMNALEHIAPQLVSGMMKKAADTMTERYMLQMEPVITQLGELWEQEWFPEIKQHLAFWSSFNLTGATLPELIAHFQESLERLSRVWEIHWQIVFPSFLAMGLYEELYCELFGAGKTFEAYRLVQGFDNTYLKADRALWRLSRQALTMPRARQALERCTAGDVESFLKGSPEGEIFFVELQRFLAEYGQRGHHRDGLMDVSWMEDPTPMVHRLQDYISQPDRDLEAELHFQALEREHLIAQARERLKDSAPITAQRFEMLLKAAQAASFLHEEHNYWIDQRCQYQLRCILLQCGNRLVQEEIISEPGDVFYLTVQELIEAASLPARSNRQSEVRERKAEMQRFGAIKPPAWIGTMPWIAPPDVPFIRSLGRVFGEPLVPTAMRMTIPPETNIVRGHAASAGIVRGRARVIHRLTEAGRLQPGDILVTQATMPPWTPLFATAGAIVTDVGGILSHAAVVAREYRIPAVVGTRTATTRIGDGQLLQVDGNTGVVQLL